MQYPPSVVRSYSSGVYGRCISQAGTHHFVVDHAVNQDGPGEQPGPVEHFLSSVSACGVLMLERQAKLRGIPVQHIDVRVEGVRRALDETFGGPTTLERVAVAFEFTGPSQQEAEVLVDYYKRH